MSTPGTRKTRRLPRLATALSLAAAGLLWLLSATPALAVPPPINEFTINVPDKIPGPPGTPPPPGIVQIQTLRVIVTVVDGSVNNTFTVTPPSNSSTPAAQSAALNHSSSTAALVFAAPAGVPGVSSDIVTITPDPTEVNKFIFIFNLNSDYQVASFCSDGMNGDEAWKVGTSGNQITGICVQSIDQPGCTGDLRTVPLSQAIATVTVSGMPVPQSLQGCRPPVDVILVLDRSGSMGGGLTASDMTPKINRLHDSVTTFMSVWNTLKTNETSMSASPPIAAVNDHVAVALFDSTMPAKWLGEIGVGSSLNGLTAYTNADAGGSPNATYQDIITHIGAVTPNTATSIGSGLLKADGEFTANGSASNRKLILLMSDGLENTFPTSTVVGNQVATIASPGAMPVPLANNARIYAVTVGSGAGIVDAAFNQALATATGGAYANTETDASMMSTFFLQALQNFIKYSSVETFRLASGTAGIGSPFQATVPVTSTTQSITFTVTWDSHFGPMKATVTPPGGGPPIVQTSSSGTLIVNTMLPVAPAKTSAGDYAIKVEPQPQIGSLRLPQIGNVPVNLTVMGDDTALDTVMAPVAADYIPGGKIRLRARITELDKPLTGLNSQPGAKVLVRMFRPGASVGDLLSDSSVTPGPPKPGDPQSAASAKLEAILAKDPNALNPTEQPLTLFDDGSPAHGDDVANDGVYSTLFAAPQVGHYNFIFALEGSTKRLGRFSRQQIQTVFVRAFPDASTTQFQSSVSGNTLTILMTPKTGTGARMGPGFANYFWFTAPGIQPVKPVDNMNGTYTATINFTGSTPPSPVAFHFERDLVRLFDDVTADKLPTPLGPGNTVVSSVPVPGGQGGGFKRWGLSLHGGVSFPHGPNFAVDLEYRLTQTFSLEGIYGFHRFTGETFGTVKVGDLNLHQFSFNGKVYGGGSPVRPFFNFGGGVYHFGAVGTTNGGLNVGGGIQFDVTPTFAVEGVYNFHNIFTSGQNTRFSALQGGVRFRF
jgi:opacity protein-like surface antigen